MLTFMHLIEHSDKDCKNFSEKKKYGIAMSGGVDSTSCALLVKKNYHVSGYFMKLAQPDIEFQIDRVTQIADTLGISLKILDLQEQFQNKVLDYFTGSYFKGRTPNPCVICNREIKFGLFMDAILNEGHDCVATGHYARIERQGDLFRLFKGADPTKDQSYFLSRLSQKQLSRTLFPLGGMQKEDIYTFAEEHGFNDFRGKESQDVCFLKDMKVGEYLDDFMPDPDKGPIVSLEGKVLGEHEGLHKYTVGQRRGLGISDVSPWYVVKLSPETNTLIVGKNEDLYHSTITIHNTHWINGSEPDFTREYQVRIRYSHSGSAATLKKLTHSLYRLSFSLPQRAITPGQFTVIYDGDEVIGSGEIHT